MKNIAIMLFCLFAAACNSCTPLPGPAPTPVPTVVFPDAGPPPAAGGAAPVVDSGTEPDIDRSVRDACTAIAHAGCPEGGPSCGPVMQRALTERLTIVPLVCLVGAADKAAVRACGFVACK